MPIPRAQLEEAQRPLKERIVDFLAQDSSQAFSLLEVYAAMNGYDAMTVRFSFASLSPAQRAATVGAFEKVLIELVRDGQVVQARHQGQDFFAVSADDSE